MGRGRAKAKQQKVARELKYSTPSTDFSALQRELGGEDRSDHGLNGSDGEFDDEDDWSIDRER